MFWNLKKYLTFTFFSEQSSCREDVFSSSKDKKYPKGGKPGAGLQTAKPKDVLDIAPDIQGPMLDRWELSS